MKKTLILLMVLAIGASSIFAATFDQEKTKTADGEDFLFPTDALQKGAAIFALTMGKDRDNGEVQQKEVIAWQKYLLENPDTVGSTPVYHFPVLSGVPFFVKGTIRKALYDYYTDVVDPARVGVLFVSKTEKFAKQAEIPFDDESILVVVASDGTVVGYVKGAVTPAKAGQLKKMISSL
ncbi:MAG: hypothetical protein EOM68_07515 [Spirochaetia bacterium]|nr:hypothetical protein [Spirochaetia bacterium]